MSDTLPPAETTAAHAGPAGTMTLAPWGLLAIGLGHVVLGLLPLIARTTPGLTVERTTRIAVVALTTLVAYALAALAVRWLVQTVARLIALADVHGEASARTADALARIAGALERQPASPSAPHPTPPPADPRAVALAAIREAIREARWDEAESSVLAFVESYPDDPATPRLPVELAARREAVAADLLSSLDAARQVNDPGGVLDLRDALGPLLDDDRRRSLDADLARWIMKVLQKRLLGGKIAPDVAVLAGRAVESFAGTPEAASLRAALPTLRRSVGLCARCARPYNGVEDACPVCLGVATPADPDPTLTATADASEDEIADDPGDVNGDPFDFDP